MVQRIHTAYRERPRRCCCTWESGHRPVVVAYSFEHVRLWHAYFDQPWNRQYNYTGYRGIVSPSRECFSCVVSTRPVLSRHTHICHMDIFSATPGCAHESCVFAGRTDPLLQIHTEHRKFQTFNGSITTLCCS